MTRRGAFDGRGQAAALRGLLRWQTGVGLVTASGKTLRDIERELGLAQQSLNRYLSGRTPLTLADLPLFAAAFETTPADLAVAIVEDSQPPELEAELARLVSNPQQRARLLTKLRVTPPSVQRVALEMIEAVGENSASRPAYSKTG